jgi:hypothetical protein
MFVVSAGFTSTEGSTSLLRTIFPDCPDSPQLPVKGLPSDTLSTG